MDKKNKYTVSVLKGAMRTRGFGTTGYMEDLARCCCNILMLGLRGFQSWNFAAEG